MTETLLAGIKEMNLEITEEQISLFCAFGAEMLEKNKVMNLTAIKEPSAVAELHFLDSLALLTAVDFTDKKVIDVGCGAGFPGVPLKIACPSMELTLLDSLGKRMTWLEETLDSFGVDGTCVTARAEEYVLEHRESFDIATSRAVARLNILCELCLPYVKIGGCFVAMKGAASDEEITQATKAIATLGGTVEKVFEYRVGESAHRGVIIRKVSLTPYGYPRVFGKIKAKPL